MYRVSLPCPLSVSAQSVSALSAPAVLLTLFTREAEPCDAVLSSQVLAAQPHGPGTRFQCGSTRQHSVLPGVSRHAPGQTGQVRMSLHSRKTLMLEGATA